MVRRRMVRKSSQTVCYIHNVSIYQEILNEILTLDTVTLEKIKIIIGNRYKNLKKSSIGVYASAYFKLLREDEYLDENGHPLYKNVNLYKLYKNIR